MKLENMHEQVTAEIEKALGQNVRIRVSGDVVMTYYGMLNRATGSDGDGGHYSVCRAGGPEVFFSLSAVRAIHCGPGQDMLAIHIGGR